MAGGNFDLPAAEFEEDREPGRMLKSLQVSIGINAHAALFFYRDPVDEGPPVQQVMPIDMSRISKQDPARERATTESQDHPVAGRWAVI